MGLYNMERTTPKLVKDVLKTAYEPYYNLGGVVNITKVDDGNFSQPDNFILRQNFPNPFNPNTIISWNLAKESSVQLKIYDVLGREVASLINEKQTAGEYKINFNADEYGLCSGIYFYKLVTNEFTDIKKMILLK